MPLAAVAVRSATVRVRHYARTGNGELGPDRRDMAFEETDRLCPEIQVTERIRLLLPIRPRSAPGRQIEVHTRGECCLDAGG